jgi:hypothetical protein
MIMKHATRSNGPGPANWPEPSLGTVPAPLGWIRVRAPDTAESSSHLGARAGRVRIRQGYSKGPVDVPATATVLGTEEIARNAYELSVATNVNLPEPAWDEKTLTPAAFVMRKVTG